MSERPRLLIVLADGEHARFVRPGPDGVLRTDESEDSRRAHKRSSDLGSDRPGESFHSDSSAHHAFSPRHDLHALEKAKFAHAIADQLNEAEANGEFGSLLLVAPAHTVNAIREHLNRATAGRILAVIEKDLAKVPDNELASHLTPWAHPAKRVPPYEASSGN
jgi:protein required for attachment to host cells